MKLLPNPLRHAGLSPQSGLARGRVIAEPRDVLALLERCPVAKKTPLRRMPELARGLEVGELWLKDESERMGLGSFKALGAAYAIARLAAQRMDRPGKPASHDALAQALADEVFVCASAGNHGLSVAAGARLFGARAVIYLSVAIPEAFAQRLQRAGARVVREGADYEASMAAAAGDAESNGWILLSDSSWPGYTEWPMRVMEGYLAAGDEACGQIAAPPTHILLQAGVGGFAAAMTALFRARWGDEPRIAVVEPDAAHALLESVRAGRPVTAAGPVSNMGRLDCKTPSHLALDLLASQADVFLAISDERCAETVSLLQDHGVATTPSGAAGVSAVHHAGEHRQALELDGKSRVLAFITEGPEEP